MRSDISHLCYGRNRKNRIPAARRASAEPCPSLSLESVWDLGPELALQQASQPHKPGTQQQETGRLRRSGGAINLEAICNGPLQHKPWASRAPDCIQCHIVKCKNIQRGVISPKPSYLCASVRLPRNQPIVTRCQSTGRITTVESHKCRADWPRGYRSNLPQRRKDDSWRSDGVLGVSEDIGFDLDV